MRESGDALPDDPKLGLLAESVVGLLMRTVWDSQAPGGAQSDELGGVFPLSLLPHCEDEAPARWVGGGAVGERPVSWRAVWEKSGVWRQASGVSEPWREQVRKLVQDRNAYHAAALQAL